LKKIFNSRAFELIVPLVGPLVPSLVLIGIGRNRIVFSHGNLVVIVAIVGEFAR
jgi:hypothetical protein